MIRRVLLIANPASRSGDRLATRAERALVEAGVSCDLSLTERPGHAAELARAHTAVGGHEDPYDALFVLGGDGTVMEVAGALVGTECPVGILAAGTGNLLARSFAIPRRIERAVPALLAGDVARIDLGRMDSGRHFAIAAGVGIDAAMIGETPAWLKRRLGVLAYTLIGSRAAIRSVVRQHNIHARITVDGVTDECVAVSVMIANIGGVLGDRITLGPEIRAHDGFLDVCIFSPRSLPGACHVMWRLVRGDFSPHPSMAYRRGRTIRVETDRPCAAQADGELVGTTPFTVSVVPQAARLLVPRRG